MVSGELSLQWGSLRTARRHPPHAAPAHAGRRPPGPCNARKPPPPHQSDPPFQPPPRTPRPARQSGRDPDGQGGRRRLCQHGRADGAGAVRGSGRGQPNRRPGHPHEPRPRPRLERLLVRGYWPAAPPGHPGRAARGERGWRRRGRRARGRRGGAPAGRPTALLARRPPLNLTYNPCSLLTHRAQVRMMLPVMVASAFLNNTPIVALLIPILLSWSRRCARSPRSAARARAPRRAAAAQGRRGAGPALARSRAPPGRAAAPPVRAC